MNEKLFTSKIETLDKFNELYDHVNKLQTKRKDAYLFQYQDGKTFMLFFVTKCGHFNYIDYIYKYNPYDCIFEKQSMLELKPNSTEFGFKSYGRMNAKRNKENGELYTVLSEKNIDSHIYELRDINLKVINNLLDRSRDKYNIYLKDYKDIPLKIKAAMNSSSIIRALKKKYIIKVSNLDDDTSIVYIYFGKQKSEIIATYVVNKNLKKSTKLVSNIIEYDFEYCRELLLRDKYNRKKEVKTQKELLQYIYS